MHAYARHKLNNSVTKLRTYFINPMHKPKRNHEYIIILFYNCSGSSGKPAEKAPSHGAVTQFLTPHTTSATQHADIYCYVYSDPAPKTKLGLRIQTQVKPVPH